MKLLTEIHVILVLEIISKDIIMKISLNVFFYDRGGIFADVWKEN